MSRQDRDPVGHEIAGSSQPQKTQSQKTWNKNNIADISRRLPIGAEILPSGDAHFRVWSDNIERISVVIVSGINDNLLAERELEPECNGYFSTFIAEAKEGDSYSFRLNNQPELFPDPASRFQPRGPFGPSQLVDPNKFSWTDSLWKGIERQDQVIYEMHIGTFTREGTYTAASDQLAELANLGIGVIEVMPLADFPGQFGWGYDGVNLFAPTRLYGKPDDLRRFIDIAHSHGIGIILDIVYNHLGPSGQFLDRYSTHYFSERYTTEWGRAINFDDQYSAPVREFFLANASYWIDEFHFDGLRFDATQTIFDSSDDHILAAVVRQVQTAARGRSTLLVAENEPQHTQLVRPQEQGGYGIDALWNDDFHHCAKVAMTGHNEAYYLDYTGTPQQFISAVKYGFLYQGQMYKWQHKRRGTPSLDLSPCTFINFIQNHDQIANSAHGLRCHELTSPGIYRAMTALLLLTSSRPMLFQGQEFAASSPFIFFADHTPELAEQFREGRIRFLSQFPSLAATDMQRYFSNPADPAIFEKCKLDFGERLSHNALYTMHRDLLRLRLNDPLFQCHRQRNIDGAVLGPKAFLLRFFGQEGDDRLLLINFGIDLQLNPAPEPLLAPPENRIWSLLWSSENPIYGGSGTPQPETDNNWIIQGQAAIVMTAIEQPKTSNLLST